MKIISISLDKQTLRKLMSIKKKYNHRKKGYTETIKQLINNESEVKK